MGIPTTPQNQPMTAGKKGPMDIADFTQMTNDEIFAWIEEHKGTYTPRQIFAALQQDNVFSSEEILSVLQSSYNLSTRDFLDLRLFAESPWYDVPEEYFKSAELGLETGAAMIEEAGRTRARTMTDLMGDIARSEGTLTEARDRALGFAEGDISKVRDIADRTRALALDEAYKTRARTLAELEAGGEKALDLMKLQAFGGLPGERMYQEQVAANTAAMARDIRERGGGLGASLGALTEGYTQGQAGYRDILSQRAQYQAAGMGQLAEGEYNVSGRMAEAIRGTGMDYIDTLMATGRDVEDAYLATSEYYTGLVGDYGKTLADLQFRGGVSKAEVETLTSRNLMEAMERGGGMGIDAYKTLGQQRDKAWAINYYEPYMAQRDFLINELYRLDPFGTTTQYFGDLIGQGYSQYMAGASGQANAWQNFSSGVNNSMSNVIMAQLLYGDDKKAEQ